MRTPMPVIEETDVRRGPWTLEEDTLLTHYISRHGEGRWNMLAKCAGLKRSGKSCRLRWLNYLKPDIKRGNLTSQEQLLILELHAKWGNKWSKIAQHLPGRTDNEIKNYWRTRVQKQARQLNIESSGKEFMDAVRCYWMPRLLQEMDQTSISPSLTNPNSQNTDYLLDSVSMSPIPTVPPFITSSCPTETITKDDESSSSVTKPTQPKIPVAPDFIGDQNVYNYLIQSDSYYDVSSYDMEGFNLPWSCHAADGNWASDDVADTTWNMDDIWQFREGGVTN